MTERLKLIRRHFKMNQSEFAQCLGIGQSTLAMMEVGKRDILERHIRTICSILGVNEHWFRTGKGEMLVKDEQLIERLANEYRLNNMGKAFISTFLQLTRDQQDAVIQFALKLAETASALAYSPESIEEQVDMELAKMREAMILEKKAAEKSSALKNTGTGDIR